MPTRLIINADDFGFSPGVNRGVVECLARGLITSATIIPNAPGSLDALAYARYHPEYGFGLHLNLMWGKPLAGGAVPSLCGPDGRFWKPLRFLLRLACGLISADDLAREIRAQIQFCRENGVAVSHIDSHKHLHMAPRIYRVLTAVAWEEGIDAYRLPREDPIGQARFGWKAIAFRTLSRPLAAHLDRTGCRHPDHFAGGALMGSSFTPANLSRAIRALPGPTAELMVHPGRPEADFGKIDPYVHWRYREIDVLGDPLVRDAIAESGCELIDFRSLRPPAR